MSFDFHRFMERAEWTERAACHGSEAVVFYPNVFKEPALTAAFAAARPICQRCPVQAECLAYAMNNAEREGMWGGLTPTERVALAGGKLVAATPPPVRARHDRRPSSPSATGRGAVS